MKIWETRSSITDAVIWFSYDKWMRWHTSGPRALATSLHEILRAVCTDASFYYLQMSLYQQCNLKEMSEEGSDRLPSHAKISAR